METRFQFTDFLKVFLLVIGLYAGFAGLFAAVPNVTQLIESLPTSLAFVIQYLLQFVILFFPLWIFVVNKYETTWSDFGFHPVSWKVLLKNVVGSYFFYLILSTSIALLLTAYDLKMPGYEAQDSYLPLFGTGTINLMLGFVFVIVVAPFLEELLFRGFVYRVFAKTWTPWLGSLLTASLFALAHLQFQTFFPLFILGIILNRSYQKTGSVWTPIALHSVNNAIAFSVNVYLTNHPQVLDSLSTLVIPIFSTK